MPKAITFETFEGRVRENNPSNNLVYLKETFKTAAKPCQAICPVHGEITVAPKAQMSGAGCRQCGRLLGGGKKGARSVERALAEIHKKYLGKITIKKGQKLKVVTRQKIIAVCREHGEFKTQLGWLTNRTKHGCPECAKKACGMAHRHSVADWEKIISDKTGTEVVINRLYIEGERAMAEVTCQTHGVFTIIATTAGNSPQPLCPLCSKETGIIARQLGTVEIVRRINEKFGDNFDCSRVTATNIRDWFTVRCRKHDVEFRASYKSLFSRGVHYGCPKCASAATSSQWETSLRDKVSESLGLTVVANDREVLQGKEIDILIPAYKLGVECNGIYHHAMRPKKHRVNDYDDDHVRWAKWHKREKQEEAKAKGITLIHFDEILDESKMLRFIANRCGMTPVIYARKTEYREVTPKVAAAFLNKYHLQGAAYRCKYGGLFSRNKLIAVIAMSKPTSVRGKSPAGTLELRRIAFSWRVVGGAGKLLKNFLVQRPYISTVITYSHDQWFDGKSYAKIGFVLDRKIPPDYQYVHNNKLLHKSCLQKRNMAKLKGFTYDPDMTELENATINNYYRLYDCGKKKWILTINKEGR